MRRDTFLFDLDGTLLDTLDDLTAATNAALRAYGCPPRTKEGVQGFAGNGVRLLLTRAAPGGEDNPHFSEIYDFFKTYYAVHCFDNTKPYPGIPVMLAGLKDRGCLVGVLSNKADFAVQQLVSRFFPGLADGAAGEDEEGGVRKKPAPDLVYSVLKRLGSDPSRAVYVGDSEVDVQTAVNASLPCLSVTWGFKTREFLLSHGATALVSSPAEILLASEEEGGEG